MEVQQAGLLVTIMDVANIGAWIVIAWFFIQGKIVSQATMDKLAETQLEATTKLSNEIGDKIEDAVYNGTVKAHADMNGKGKSKEK